MEWEPKWPWKSEILINHQASDGNPAVHSLHDILAWKSTFLLRVQHCHCFINGRRFLSTYIYLTTRAFAFRPINFVRRDPLRGSNPRRRPQQSRGCTIEPLTGDAGLHYIHRLHIVIMLNMSSPHHLDYTIHCEKCRLFYRAWLISTRCVEPLKGGSGVEPSIVWGDDREEGY